MSAPRYKALLVEDDAKLAALAANEDLSRFIL